MINKSKYNIKDTCTGWIGFIFLFFTSLFLNWTQYIKYFWLVSFAEFKWETINHLDWFQFYCISYHLKVKTKTKKSFESRNPFYSLINKAKTVFKIKFNFLFYLFESFVGSLEWFIYLFCELNWISKYTKLIKLFD